jgi:hypothetical protein
MHRFLAAAFVLGLVATSCGSSTSPSTTTAAPSTPVTSTTTATTAPAEGVAFTMDDHVTWLLGVLDAGEFDAAEVTERFDPLFLEEVPVEALNAPLGQVAPEGSEPWQVVEETIEGSVAEITVESADGTRLKMTVAMSSSAPNQIEGLLLQPVVDVPEGYTTAQLDADMEAFAAEGAIGIYEVTDGSCQAVHEFNGDQPLAIGSAFKLWVLAELANQVADGTAAWDEPLEVRADLRSSPDGEVFQLADGDTLTLRQYAEVMISISDNTATDHLIDRLGREEVEAAMIGSGVADPALNQPFLATHELFWLKYAPDEPNPSDWYQVDVAGRRDILASLEGKPAPWMADPSTLGEGNADGVPLDQPRNLDIEYFASPQDLCRTLVHLDELAGTPGLEPVAEILSINPGLPLDTSTWTDVRFKGGSEPGVVALAWWLAGADGRRFVVAGALNDPEVAFAQTAAIQIISTAIGLIPPEDS